MRKLLFSLATLALALSTTPAHATADDDTDTVSTIMVNDTDYGPGILHMIQVTGFSSAGTCATTGGLVILRIRDDEKGRQQLALALAAKLAGLSVYVQANDSYKVSGGNDCYLRTIKLQ